MGEKLELVISDVCQTGRNPLGSEWIRVAGVRSYPGNIEGLDTF